MESNKVNNEGFTLSLALVDALPVIFFSISMILIASEFPSPLFLVGALITALSGLAKVIWKIIFSFGKDIKILNKQFRYCMSGGFLIIILSIIIFSSKIDWLTLQKNLFKLPQLILFIISILFMCVMFVLAFVLDKNKASSNWIEQCVNSVAQLLFMLGIIFLIF